MKAMDVWKELMDIADCESAQDRLIRVAHSIEMYGEMGKEERKELEAIRSEHLYIAEKIGEILA